MRRLVFIALLALVGCHDKALPPLHAMKLGGVEVSAERLEHGRAIYLQYCRACHGDSGHGDGPASVGLRPPPRNFTKGIFKFAGTVPRDGAPTLPRDEDLVRIIRGGLHGSAMLAWDVPDPALGDVIQYLKTFSPKWQTELPGDPLVPSPDPYAKRDAEGVEAGKRLYHVVAQCSACHPAYATRAEIAAGFHELKPGVPPTFRDDLYQSSPVDSIELSVDGKHPLRVLPPDFLHKQLKSVRPNHELEDLYRVISVGINGAGMPPWRDALPEDQIWAITHYVRALVDLRDTPGADALAKQLAAANAPDGGAH